MNQPFIETARLQLRPPRPADAEALWTLTSDPRVARATRSIPHPLPEGAVDAFIARSAHPERTEDAWIMDGSRSDLPEVAGVVALTPMDRAQSEIAYWVAPDLWNTGLASEAVGALLEANPQDCATVFASVFQDNPISARVLTNAGFAYIGDAEALCAARGGAVPTWTYLRRMR
ncbi:hypothetical protein OCGS_0148 [Oceaniovalibus guishaninsula JLT2003]|uniref:N-acetyltransferase domain-containing protein n=1 Tax=Oceaniovalibus guishaninsula JLT2003 TaxID=1231392 RepID=K2HSX6_9RHOB|nr:hypothetical protein OCGS_0148 [Oceaniovalibus guishaninsula JLT2003]